MYEWRTIIFYAKQKKDGWILSNSNSSELEHCFAFANCSHHLRTYAIVSHLQIIAFKSSKREILRRKKRNWTNTQLICFCCKQLVFKTISHCVWFAKGKKSFIF